MKKIICASLALFFVVLSIATADSLDKAWIIEADTGSAATMERLDRPNLSPGDTIDVYLEKRGLSVKWGEGYATYTYSYYTEGGKEIWTSEVYSERKPYSGASWEFAQVHRVTLPSNIPPGAYRLGFTVTDYHTKKTYKGNVEFTVGAAAAVQPASPDTAVGEESGAYVVMIGDVEMTLTAVEKTSNRLTLTFRGLNKGDTDERLDVYSYGMRIISRQGEEFVLSAVGGGGNLESGVRFAPQVPMMAELYLKPPATKVNHISYLEIPFYYFDDKIVLRDIPVPYRAE